MSTPARRLPSENREPLPSDDPRADIPCDEDPPIIGRQDLNPWRPAFVYQLFGEGAESPGGVDDDEEIDVPPIPLRRARRGMQLAPAPRLGVRIIPAAGALSAELTQETAGRDRFLIVTPSDLYRYDETFARSRLTSLDSIRRADRGARRIFFRSSGIWAGDPSRRCSWARSFCRILRPRLLNPGRLPRIRSMGELLPMQVSEIHR